MLGRLVKVYGISTWHDRRTAVDNLQLTHGYWETKRHRLQCSGEPGGCGVFEREGDQYELEDSADRRGLSGLRINVEEARDSRGLAALQVDARAG